MNVYSALAPQRAPTPYIVYVRKSVKPLHMQTGPPSPGILQRIYTFSIYDPSQSRTIMIADALRVLLDGYRGVLAVAANPSAQQYGVSACLFRTQKYMFDRDTQLHMQALDFFIQFS